MKKQSTGFTNPFRPGAGHMPPYLAGRQPQQDEFKRLLDQNVILENLVLTGLRGVGKTVLLETFRPLAQEKGWYWAGTDLSESASINEENLATRILTDVAIATSSIIVGVQESQSIGFVGAGDVSEVRLNYTLLRYVYENAPGLVSDKLKAVLELVAGKLPGDCRGIVFAYDEAQNMSDHAGKDQHPLSLLLDVFQSLQKKGVPFMLALTGLPTLFPKLVEARTYAERMFRVIILDQLDEEACKDAITIPIEQSGCPVHPSEQSVQAVTDVSGGYPYFVQFICREAYDVWARDPNTTVPLKEILQKLDTDFFAGRWAKATDRQRDLMIIISALPNSDGEFTVQEIVETSSTLSGKPFSNSHVNQMLSALSDAGLIFKNRHGRYSFAVPLLARFIRRQENLAETG